MVQRRFVVRGFAGESQDTPVAKGIKVEKRGRLIPGRARDGSGAERQVAADEVVRVELENGFIYWTRADDLVRERGRKTVARDGGDAWEIEVRPASRSGAAGSSRGLLGLGIKLLDFFGVDLKEKAAAALGKTLEERQLKRAPGLYRLAMGGSFQMNEVSEGRALPAADKPMLVFIHGTGSSCEGSYAALWNADPAHRTALAALRDTYGESVYAWEHRSLTQSPIQNALELVVRLPDAVKSHGGVTLHLVSHSRGGLVGELLCLGQRDRTNDPLGPDLIKSLFQADRTIAEQLGLDPLDADAAKERDKSYEADRDRLKLLLELLDKKAVKVARFVRVACPARGTTLASGRLDRWLSVVDFLVGKVTGNGLFSDGLEFLLAVVKERTDPRTLPGLEAMMPGSALTRMLQHLDLRTAADLSVISGDIDGDSLWSQLKLLAVDWFYAGDHDLVVNTGSMYGGIRRIAKCSRFLMDKGAGVNHFNYFANEKSLRWLVAGLTRAEGSDGGFQPIELAKAVEPAYREAVRRSRDPGPPKPLAVVLPGTMGSAMRVESTAVWLDYWALCKGGLGRLRMGAHGVEPVDLLGQFYGPLLEFLSRSHSVQIFPYDWRLSVRDAALKLALKLEDWLPEAERTRQPVHLVAHSMGGLVVRAMIADGGRGAAVWKRIVALPNSRFLMLGTPNLGSYEAVRWLTGLNATQAKLSLLNLAHSTNEIIDIVREFPGLVELLPFDPDSPDFADPKLWNGLTKSLGAGWTPAEDAVLRQARDTWSRLKQAAPEPRLMLYAAGCQDATAAKYELVDYDDDSFASGRKRIDFLGVHQGDGTVTWKSGFLPGVPVWYIEDTAHDELCAQVRALPGYLDLLMTGTTRLLPNTPPAGSRAATDGTQPFRMPAVPPTDDIPDERSIRALGFGPGRAAAPVEDRQVVPVIQASVCHGDLAYARHPVVVGHYLGDAIISAEAALDRRLEGALSRRLQLGLYPGQARTHALFLNEKKGGKPGGAVVIGLGQAGELSPSQLQNGVRDALLDLALQVAHCADERFGPPGSVRSAAVSCLLVGSGLGGLTVRDSVEAILRGAVDANLRLERAKLNGRVLIDKLEFLELQQDLALAAAEALESVLQDGQLAHSVVWATRVVERGEGRLRRLRADDTPGWWHRMEIIEEQGQGGLRFVASTDRARAEVTQATGQLRLAQRFIEQASRSPASASEVSKTLFEMLLPNSIKELAPHQTALVLLVDEDSARYPWELLEDRWGQSGRPPAVCAGLVRQLKTLKFRARPAHASAGTAFVVGNPDLEGAKDFADLPGARREAQEVAQCLAAGGYRVSSCVDAKTDDIIEGLHEDAWRILHLAGHGVHEFALRSGDSSSGMVIGNNSSMVPGSIEQMRRADAGERISGMVIGDNSFLTPGDVEQMRWVPELVFINCCHLGKGQSEGHGRYPQLAANLGMQFVDMGVKAVVAAGWAVDDAAATAFAKSFYARMLAGESFGEAVRAAREEIWVRFPNVNTWGAYQCYGDPGFRLYVDGASRPRQDGGKYHDPAELIAALDNLTEGMRMQVRDKGGDPGAIRDARTSIEHLFDGIPQGMRDRWLGRADVAVAVGFAYGEIGGWAEGIECLSNALSATEGDCPVRALEQRANYRVRLAAERWSNIRAASDRPVAKARAEAQRRAQRQALVAEIENAIEELSLLGDRVQTPERLNLLASACKRLAWIQTAKAARSAALGKMAAQYRAAFDLGKCSDPYPFANWAVAKLLSRTDANGQWRASLPADCASMIDVVRARDAEAPSFWNSVGEADCELVLLLMQPDPPVEAGQRIAQIYRAAAERAASPREYASVREHLEFVIEVGAFPRSSAMAAALAAIRAAL